MVGLEVSAPDMGRIAPHQMRLSRGPSNLASGTFRDGAWSWMAGRRVVLAPSSPSVIPAQKLKITDQGTSDSVKREDANTSKCALEKEVVCLESVKKSLKRLEEKPLYANKMFLKTLLRVESLEMRQGNILLHSK